MSSDKNVVHSFKTSELNSWYLSWLRATQNQGPSEHNQSIGLGCSLTYNNSLYGAIIDIRRTLHSFKQLPIHRIIRAITIAFECPIEFPSEYPSKEINSIQSAGHTSALRRKFGVKPSEIKLHVCGQNGIFSLTIGSPKDFWVAVNEFLVEVQEMHNMIAVWKHANRAKSNIKKHGYDGAVRELNELSSTLSNWLTLGNPLA